MSTVDPDIDRVRAALSSTDSELDADRLRVRLIVERAETAHPGKRWSGRHAVPGLVGLLVAGSIVVGIGYQARLQDRAEIAAVPTASGDVQPTVTTSPASSDRSTAAGERLLQRVTDALGRTRLTAFMATKIDNAAEVRQTATVTHSPAEQMMRAEVGARAYLNLGHGGRQLLVDQSARRIWSATPDDTSLADRMNVFQIDPLAQLLTRSRSRSATRSESADPDRALLRLRQRGLQLDCVVDLTSYLPQSCRTSAAGAVAGETSTAISWRTLTAVQWKTAFNVDTPAGYTWIKVPG